MDKKEWPKYRIDLSLLAGACEHGVDLYLVGRFGGFGGYFSRVYRSQSEAKEFALKFNASVYKLSISMVDTYLKSS